MANYRKSPRAPFIDYEYGDYFITICTQGHTHFFGEIINGEMHLSELGTFLDNQLRKASDFNPDIEVVQFVVMPNHIHAIITHTHRNVNQSDQLHKRALIDESNMGQRSPNPLFRGNPFDNRHVPLISRYINSLKGAVTKYANRRGIVFAWQGRYHDHLIRGSRDGNLITDYILNNVARWENDCFNVS